MNERKMMVETLFEGALGLTAPGQRADYLNRECGGDAALREEVEGLLRAAERAGGFLAADTASQAAGTARLHLPPLQKPGDRIGRYKLLQQIGEGGCGVVYMAEQEEPVRRRVALKVIKLGMDTRQVIARFEAERQALALMDHPNIAKVLDAGATDTGRPYFVMELVRGIKITDYCDDQKLSTADRLKLFVQVCQAIQHAHQKGIIHRDLKPSNILVTVNDGVAVPKVIDFGIAKATTGQPLTDKTLFTAFEQFIGTPAYMSPEQAVMTSLDVDTRSDIYSLGVLLYELLTGRTPFDQKELLAAGLDAMRRTILEQEPPRPSTQLNSLAVEDLTTTAQSRHTDAPRLLHEVRGDLDWIVMKCLEKDRMRRYETANGLAADLRRHLHDEPVVARPPSRVYEFQKTVRRHKFGFAAAAAILLVLAGGITLTTWQAVRATRANRAEEKARQTAQVQADRAEASGMEAKITLSAADFLQAARLIAEDNVNDAVPYLARSLAADPTNDAALTRLTTLLTYRTWMLPTLVLKHEKPVNSAEYSSDGKRIVTASADGTARVWDAQSGQPLVEPMKHPFSVTSAQYSPDERRVITVSDDLTIRVWDAQTGQPVAGPMKHGSLVTSVQFSPDGKRIVTGSWDNTARVWDAETGQPLTGPLVQDLDLKEKEKKPEKKEQAEQEKAKPKGTVYSMNVVEFRISVDGSPIVYVSKTKAVTAQFSPDGKRIVTVSEDGTARVWDAHTGQPLADPATQSSPARSKQLSPDGKRKVSISSGNTVRVWDVRTDRPLTEPMKLGGDVATARFSPVGERILTASSDGAYLWEARTVPPLPLSPPVRMAWFGNDGLQWFQPQFSHDGRRIVMPLADKTACVWDAQTGEPLTRMSHDIEVFLALFSPDDQRIVTASYDKTARVWDAQTGQPVSEPITPGGYLNSVQFSPEGKRIVTSSSDRTARVWNVQTGQPLTEPMKHGDGVRAVQFSHDGRRIVTASEDGTARVWDAQTGQPLTKPIKPGGRVFSLEFSPDGKRIVTASGDSGRVWDAQTGQPLTEPMKHGGELRAAHFSPDSQRIVTASFDGDATARVWDVQTGQPLTEPISPGGLLFSAQFSPDGKRILTASDRTARVWDAQTGQPLTEPMTHGDARFGPDGSRSVDWLSAQFSPDGKRIVTTTTSSLDRKARVWDIAPTQAPCPDWLLQLAEAISGKVLNQEGVLEPTRLNRVETLNQIRQKLAALPDDDWVVWGRWLLADRATRTISPFAKVTVPEYLERLIKEKTRSSLDEAEPLAAGKPEILLRISEARQTLKEPKK